MLECTNLFVSREYEKNMSKRKGEDALEWKKNLGFILLKKNTVYLPQLAQNWENNEKRKSRTFLIELGP